MYMYIYIYHVIYIVHQAENVVCFLEFGSYEQFVRLATRVNPRRASVVYLFRVNP